MFNHSHQVTITMGLPPQEDVEVARKEAAHKLCRPLDSRFQSLLTGFFAVLLHTHRVCFFSRQNKKTNVGCLTLNFQLSANTYLHIPMCDARCKTSLAESIPIAEEGSSAPAEGQAAFLRRTCRVGQVIQPDHLYISQLAWGTML